MKTLRRLGPSEIQFLNYSASALCYLLSALSHLNNAVNPSVIRCELINKHSSCLLFLKYHARKHPLFTQANRQYRSQRTLSTFYAGCSIS